MREINTESNNEGFKTLDADRQRFSGEDKSKDNFLNPFSSTLLQNDNTSSKKSNSIERKNGEEPGEQSHKDNGDDISFDYISRKSRLDNDGMKGSEKESDSSHASEKLADLDKISDATNAMSKPNKNDQLEPRINKEVATLTVDKPASNTKSDMATLKEVFDQQNNFFKKSPVKFNKAKEKEIGNLDNSTNTVTTEILEEDLNADDSASESGI